MQYYFFNSNLLLNVFAAIGSVHIKIMLCISINTLVLMIGCKLNKPEFNIIIY